jgi:dTDP-4-amino-4,6-dideoxygalactose transaminase
MQPWREQYLVFGAPDIGPAERAAVLECLDSRWLGSGPRVAQLQHDFRAYVGATAAVAVNSGTAALQLALRLLDLPPGSEVITSPMTFCATANAIIHAGCVPVFADCDRTTMNLDPATVEDRITPRTRAILPVHFAGRPCDMPALLALARRHDLRVVEDCAHAIEATIDGRHCGTFGDFGCFSFYVTKSVTSVEGGMLLTHDPALADRAAVLALHGMSKDAWTRYTDDGFKHYEVVEPGFKFNLTDLAAALALPQLARVEASWRHRQTLWAFYEEELRTLPLHLPAPVPAHVRHAYHLFTCLIDDTRTHRTRDEVLDGLHRLRIGAGVHYRALHLQEYFARVFHHGHGDFPNAEFIGDRTFSIPLSAAVSKDDAADVVRALRQVLAP